jgi:hypothetical protein
MSIVGRVLVVEIVQGCVFAVMKMGTMESFTDSVRFLKKIGVVCLVQPMPQEPAAHLL